MNFLLAKTDPTDILIWVGALIGAVVVLTVVLLWIRNVMNKAATQDVSASSVMDSLRAMRDRGEMTEGEFETIKRQMNEKVRRDAMTAMATPKARSSAAGLDPALAAKLGLEEAPAKKETVVPPRLPEVDTSGKIDSPYVPQSRPVAKPTKAPGAQGPPGSQASAGPARSPIQSPFPAAKPDQAGKPGPPPSKNPPNVPPPGGPAR